MALKPLQKGNHIRILSPSASIEHIGGLKANQTAKEYLENLGFQISFSKHYLEHDRFDSASISSRVEDLHQAFLDDSIHAILATIGGFNANELLPYLNYDLISNNPKIICGYSDTTALLNAIYAKTGLVTYMGPAYSSFKMKEGQGYQTTSWLKALSQQTFSLEPSKEWSSDSWYDPNSPRHFHPTQWKVYNPGKAKGIAIGGSLSTFSLLRGTPYAPQPEQYILLVEAAEEDHYLDFLRLFTALLQTYPNPQAVLIGRFPKECEMTEELLLKILDRHPVLRHIPVLYDLDFAHTQPLFTVAIGGRVTIDSSLLSIQFQTK